jgi:hypothetical protein
MIGACNTHGRDKKCTPFWSENLKGRRQLGRLRRSWEDNIRIDLRELMWECVNWINLAQKRDR